MHALPRVRATRTSTEPSPGSTAADLAAAGTARASAASSTATCFITAASRMDAVLSVAISIDFSINFRRGQLPCCCVIAQRGAAASSPGTDARFAQRDPDTPVAAQALDAGTSIAGLAAAFKSVATSAQPIIAADGHFQWLRTGVEQAGGPLHSCTARCSLHCRRVGRAAASVSTHSAGRERSDAQDVDEEPIPQSDYGLPLRRGAGRKGATGAS